MGDREVQIASFIAMKQYTEAVQTLHNWGEAPISDGLFSQIFRSNSVPTKDLATFYQLAKQRGNNLTLQPTSFIRLLKYCAYPSIFSVSKRDVAMARAVFDDIVKQSKNEHDIREAYKVMLDAYLRDKNIDEAIELFYSKSKPTPELLNQLLKYYAREGEVDHAQLLFNQYQSSCVDVISYNTMVSAYCKADRVQDALNVIDSMKTIKPDTATFNTLLAFYKGNVDKMEQILARIKSHGLEYDKYTMVNVFETLGAVGMMKKAIKMATDNNVPMSPNMYSVVITHYCGRTKYSQMQKYLSDAMEQVRSDPSWRTDHMIWTVWMPLVESLAKKQAIATYQIVDSIFIDEKSSYRFNKLMRLTKHDLEATKYIFDRMQTRNNAIIPDSHSYAALLSSYAYHVSATRAHQAEQVYEQMIQKKIPPSSSVCSMFVTMYERLGDGYQESLENWRRALNDFDSNVTK